MDSGPNASADPPDQRRSSDSDLGGVVVGITVIVLLLLLGGGAGTFFWLRQLAVTEQRKAAEALEAEAQRHQAERSAGVSAVHEEPRNPLREIQEADTDRKSVV